MRGWRSVEWTHRETTQRMMRAGWLHRNPNDRCMALGGKAKTNATNKPRKGDGKVWARSRRGNENAWATNVVDEEEIRGLVEEMEGAEISGGGRRTHEHPYIVEQQGKAAASVREGAKMRDTRDIKKQTRGLASVQSKARSTSGGRDVIEDVNQLPRQYEDQAIRQFWDAHRTELASRWALFAKVSLPVISKAARIALQGGGLEGLRREEAVLAKDMRIAMEELGPTFIKLGQMLSIRPDIIGPAATKELEKLQDGVKPFSSELAKQVMRQEFGREPEEIFSEISEDPVAAASLAQVFKGRLRENGKEVAIKVQRPDALEVVSKDLYVLKRASGVYQGLVERWTAQETDYEELLQVFAAGLWNELDFQNEANNQANFKEILRGVRGVYVPDVYKEYCTRRVLVAEWVNGRKLSQLVELGETQKIKDLVDIGEEAFLEQILSKGKFHADPHPGNLLLMDDTEESTIAILDYGLVSDVPEESRAVLVSCLVHAANEDYGSLFDDFIALGVLPADSDRVKIVPVMKRVIGPYVSKGGGAANLNLQALVGDLTAATLEIPFSIPSYFALLARCVATLEGIALTGDPSYRIVMSAYPWIARRLVTESGGTGETSMLQQSLMQLVYGGGDTSSVPRRLAVLLLSASGTNKNVGGDSFLEVEALPDIEDGNQALVKSLHLLLKPNATATRKLVLDEVVVAGDLFVRKAFSRLRDSLPAPPPFLPRLPLPPVPVPGVGLYSGDEFFDKMAAPPSTEEEVYYQSLVSLISELLGGDVMGFLDRVEQSFGDVTKLPGVFTEAPRQVESFFSSVVADWENLEEAERTVFLDSGREVVERVLDKARARLET